MQFWVAMTIDHACRELSASRGVLCWIVNLRCGANETEAQPSFGLCSLLFGLLGYQ